MVGGAEKTMVNLVNEFARENFEVSLVLAQAKGPYLKYLSSNVNVVDLHSSSVALSLPGLVRYLKTSRPHVLVSALSHANVISILAKKLSSVSTKVIAREDTTLSESFKNSRSIKVSILKILMRKFYSQADYVVAVSEEVKNDLNGFLRLDTKKLKVIYNPIVTEDLYQKSKQEVDHPWFKNSNLYIIISVGRLTKAKDFPTLIKAFSFVIREVNARLIILGEGEERKNLENLSQDLGLKDYIWMPGFVENPYKYMSRSSVFVLSSVYEGLPSVLVEALALGLPIVSTDCKSGPKEILENGKYGTLVAPGDEISLAKAILNVLHKRPEFNIDDSVLERYKPNFVRQRYLELIYEVQENS
ncbi:MAG: glycosyltransferase [Candidatus Parvarchaeota archaeon]|nr:glycosyltransferase [Candidatus Rehaiarchaeum fermentans]